MTKKNESKKEIAYSNVDEARAYLTKLAEKAKALERRIDRFNDAKTPEFPDPEDADFEAKMEKFDAEDKVWSAAMDDACDAIGDGFDMIGEYQAVIKLYPELESEFDEIFN